MTFGERLRELREERNITQKTLAEVLGVSPRMVSFYESGSHFLSDKNSYATLRITLMLRRTTCWDVPQFVS